MLFVGLLGVGSARAECTVNRLLELTVGVATGRAIVPVKVNGAALNFLVDSGSSFSSLDPATAQRLKLRRTPPGENVVVNSLGGGAQPDMTIVRAFGFGGAVFRHLPLLLMPSGGGPIAGVIGQDILGANDVEYDLGHGTIRLMKSVDCAGVPLAYWADQMVFSEISIQEANGPVVKDTIGDAYLNGVRIKVMFDSGAQTSVLDQGAAARAGVRPDGPDVRPGGLLIGMGQKPMKASIANFASFKVGDEEIQNAQIRFVEIGQNLDMLLGADFFLSHRIYVANHQHRLYITYNGGPVFDAPVPNTKPDAAGPP